jgi:sugar phosphate permease
MIIPVNCSGWALLCGYLGLMSFLVLPAPFAVIAGLIAVWDIRRNPHKEGMNRVVFGFVMAVMGPLFTLPIICR